MIAIADYGMGNRRSVEKALAHVGAASVVTDDVRDASAIILPGVGAFPEAMRHLERTGLGEQLIERAAAGVPLLGICLGMQLLFESSTEHEGARGLGILPGDGDPARVAAAAAHRLEPRVLHARVVADRGPRRVRGLLPRALLRLPAVRRAPTSWASPSTASASSRWSSATT